jgi:hypothetical protein
LIFFANNLGQHKLIFIAYKLRRMEYIFSILKKKQILYQKKGNNKMYRKMKNNFLVPVRIRFDISEFTILTNSLHQLIVLYLGNQRLNVCHFNYIYFL